MKKNISNKSYINSEIPSIVLDRMAIYLRVLNQLQQEMKKLTSSKELSNYLPVEPGQIRKDLNYLGKFGINGKGYNCLLYTSPSPRDSMTSRMPSSA